MKSIKSVLVYLKKNQLLLTTAESCTAGEIIHLLAQFEGSGACLDAGFVVYSSNAKKRLLGVRQETIDEFTLSSEEVAREMVQGALRNSPADVGVATTGVAGTDPMDGVPPGTICFSWGFKFSEGENTQLFSETLHFTGDKTQILTEAAEYALLRIPYYHDLLIQTAKST
jgi:nicotinamide-nucleotide amidase